MMDATASSLLASLQRGASAADYRGLFSRFSSYLQPFSDLGRVIPLDRSHGDAPPMAVSVRPLAERFLAFICKALNLLPPLLLKQTTTPPDNGDRLDEDHRDADQLLRIYQLVLDCLVSLLPALVAQDPYKAHSHRGVFLQCLVATGRYEKAEAEAVLLLQDIFSALPIARKVDTVAEAHLSLPYPQVADNDHHPAVTTSVVEIIVALCNSAFHSKSKRSETYLRILALVEQVQPWIRLLDHEASKRSRLRLLRPLYRCAAFLNSECRSFGDDDLVSRFCVTMLRECASYSFNHLTVSATKICSGIDLDWVNGPSFFLDVLAITLELSQCQSKDQFAKGAKEFLDFISSASDVLYGAQPNICKLALSNLNDHVGKLCKICLPVGLVLSLYSAALYFRSTISLSQTGDNALMSSYATILASQEEFQCLIASIETLSSYFSQKNWEDRYGLYLFLPYLDALEFLCWVLLPYAKAGWTRFCSEGQHFSDCPNWSNISKVLQVFCNCVIDNFSVITKNGEAYRTNRMRNRLFESLVSWFRICFFSVVPYEKCCDSISIVVSSEWVSPADLKYFVSLLYNTGLELYPIRNCVKQAPVGVALKMYCKAALKYLRRISHDHLESKDISNDGSKNIKEAVSDELKRVGSIISFFHDCHPQDVTSIANITVCMLFEIILVDNLHGFQSNSFRLVKEWVKVLCKEYNDGNRNYDVPSLYQLLIKKMDPKKYTTSLGRIIEKELQAYQHLESQNPDFCKIMQNKVIKVLLEELYSKKDSFLERSRVLIVKAKALRASGTDGLRGCLDCLSEAISLLRDAKPDSHKDQAMANHQLATACCLRALCGQENKHNIKAIMEDVNSALDSWSKIDIEHYTCGDGFELTATNMVPMLCSLIDLLSIKGYYKHHSRICDLLEKTFKRENIPAQKLFALLLGDRRLAHSNCGVQMDVELITDVVRNCDASAHFTEFWANCLEDHKPSLCMFAQSLLVNYLVYPEVNDKGLEKSLQCKLGTTEIEQIASSLISNPKKASRSLFIAGYLYYDLSQRLLSEGKLIEALSYAKKAFNLHRNLLHRKFTDPHEMPYDVKREILDSVATKPWPDLTRDDTILYSFLSPWIILRSYLESIFQVGSIYELIGDGAEAEFRFQTGKKISHLQLLDSFEITFASSLGQLYRKQQLWDLADSELRNAQKLLLQSESAVSCENCKMFLETTVNLQLGDLLYSSFKNCAQASSKHTLEDALCIYRLASHNLDSSELEFTKKEIDKASDPLNPKCKFCMFLKQPAQAAVNKKASRHRKGVSKEINLDAKKMTRTTRAKSRKTSIVSETEEPSTEFNNSNKFKKKPGSKWDGDEASDTRMCWACLMSCANDSGDLINLLHLGVEFRRNSFRLSLQLKIAKTLGAQGAMAGMHEIHSLYWKCIFLLFSRSPGVNFSVVPAPQLIDLIADEKWKALSFDRALILYNMSLFLFKNLLSDQNGDSCCALANFQMQDVVTWLLKAFVFSREFPLLLQKVSRLLASTLILSTLDHSTPSPLDPKKTISINHWVSYFHQASISTSLDTLYQRVIDKIPPQVKGGTMDEAYSENSKYSRFSFENISQLEEQVECFFKNLPDVPIVCISMIDGDCAAFLEETLKLSSYPAWVMLSKIDSVNRPITMLLPADEISEVQHGLEFCKKSSSMEQSEEWKCPWNHSVLDHVVPSFKLLMRENLLSAETTEEEFWIWRTAIDKRLGLLLRNIDESWFGPWSCLLRGNPTINQKKESLVPSMVNHLESMTNSEVNPSLVKAILEGSESLEDAKECISQLILCGGSFGHGGICGKDRFRSLSTSRDSGSQIPKHVIKALEDAFSVPLVVNREPVIFVLDSYVQMFPWESLPRLRKQEIYRMPSIGSVLLTLDRNYQRHKEKGQELLLSDSYFPKVDPFDAYYVLNPSGDLKKSEEFLKPWLEELNFKGKTGVDQTSIELASALRNHEMFFYFGHGNGAKCISSQEIEKLEIRAAALLMGCSTGALTCKGSYGPQGAPLSYLSAGSPAVIANLWEVTDGEIDKFSKAIVNSWLEDTGETPVSCSACALPELPKRGRGKKTLPSGCANNRKWCKECSTKRIASSIFKARDVCRLNMLTGAAPVCYGVPTVLKRKD